MDSGPANTVSYFIGGYVVIFTIIVAYLISLAARWRALKQDEALLKELEEGKE